MDERYTIDEEFILAEKEGSFKRLVHHPRLLFRWQRKHPEDCNRIALMVSHRIGNHKYCDTGITCSTIEKFLKENPIPHITEEDKQKMLIDFIQ